MARESILSEVTFEQRLERRLRNKTRGYGRKAFQAKGRTMIRL